MRPPPVVCCLMAWNLVACTEAPPPEDTRRPDARSNESEVLYQTREVIRYVEAEHGLETARLRALGVVPPPPPSDVDPGGQTPRQGEQD